MQVLRRMKGVAAVITTRRAGRGQAGGRGSGGEVGTLIYSQGRAERVVHGLDVDQSHLGRMADLG